MRTIGVVSVGRSDLGIYLPVLREICADRRLELHLVVSGSHLGAGERHLQRDLKEHCLTVGDRVPMLLADDSPAGIALSLGLGVQGFARSYSSRRPDILLLLGDRFEMLAAAVAAVPFKIPIAHIHGGEVTQGAIDEAFRHSLTKMSHLHFASTATYAQRIIQLGEEPWRVTVSGAPALDNLRSLQLLSRSELEAELGWSLEAPPILVTYHPVTLQFEQLAWQVDELLAALETVASPILFTAANNDTHGRIVNDKLTSYAAGRSNLRVVENLGTRRYFSLMREANCMVGNSSSGLLEAASFELPVVNIGIRQAGRLAPRNVLHAGNRREDILAAIRRAASPEFRAGLRGLANPYGEGRAAEAIVGRLRDIPLDDRLLLKRFHDLPQAQSIPLATSA